MAETVQDFVALYAGAGACGAIGTKEGRGVGVRLGLTDNELNTRVSWKGANTFEGDRFQSSGDGKSDIEWPNAQRAQKRNDCWTRYGVLTFYSFSLSISILPLTRQPPDHPSCASILSLFNISHRLVLLSSLPCLRML
jgi:hypothetical protein